MRRVRCLAVLLAALSGAALGAPEVAARIDGAPLYALSVDALAQQAPGQTASAGRAAALRQAINNRLLATAGRREFKDAELHPATRVTFARDVAADDTLLASLRGQYGKELEAALRALPGGTLDGLIRASAAPDAAALERVFGKAGALQLAYTLNPQQIAQAKGIVLLRYSLAAGTEGGISLYDIYRRQNVQGRVELFNRNQPFMAQQARLQLAGLFTRRWAEQRFGAAAVEDLRLTLDEQNEVRALLAMHGVGDDIESESALLGRLAQQVGAGEIAAYYRAHKSEFTRIERVRARHIRVADEGAGKVVLAAAARGEDFGALARRYSTAEDAASGGELGWIVHEGKLSWLQQLVFMQTEGEVSRPYRAPLGPNQAAPWEIVLVERKVQGYQAADSEAVQYAARKALAREKAAAQLQALRERLRREANIEIKGNFAAAPGAPA
ncbi:peptidylprolyl isomerase [Janthinobacterium sp.]|uniref:peptidylprolyl isomerase n=1 Tax=Janthinobacterium sp. TaxID=1871054 RepID=UPI00293D4C68|nr:peptidylprolyl isomerase [Janthinobacterium sp.]